MLFECENGTQAQKAVLRAPPTRPNVAAQFRISQSSWRVASPLEAAPLRAAWPAHEGTIGSRRLWRLAGVVAAPDQPIDRYPARDVTQTWNERDQQQREAQHRHRDDHHEVGVGIAGEGWNLVPERIQP